METWLEKGLGDLFLRSEAEAGESFFRPLRSRRNKMETWLSGRKHLTANEAGSKSPPGFESLRLRIDNLLVS